MESRQQIIAAGNAKAKTGNRSGDSNVSAILKDADEALKIAGKGPKARDAVAQARIDSRSAYGSSGSSNRMSAVDRRKLERLLAPAKTPKPTAEPLEPVPHTNKQNEDLFRTRTAAFMLTPPGPAKEEHRRAVGDVMTRGSLFENHPGMAKGADRGQIMHPCQTEGCSNLADYAHDAFTCSSCDAKGNY